MRPAEFSDLQGLIQGLSTGIQGELDKLASGMSGRPVRWRRAGCCGWRRGRCSWPGGRSCWRSWMPGWPGMTAPGRGWWRCAGWAARARPAWRWSTPTVTWPRSGWRWQFARRGPGGAGGRVRRAGRPARRRPIAGTRWPRCTRCWPPARRRGCWCSTTRRTGPRWRAFVPPAGPGRVLITSRNQIWPPGQAAGRAGAGPAGGGGVPGQPDRRRGPAGGPGAGRGAGRAAAGAGAGRRVRPGQRGQPGRVPGLVPAAARGPAGPRRADRVPPRRWPPPGRLAFEDLQQAAPGAAGLLRLLAFCAPEAIPLRLLLQPRPGLAGQLGEEVAPVLAPLLEDRAGGR